MVRKLFLTPPQTVPLEVDCRTLEIPSHPLWLGIFNAAILQTTYAWNYEQINDTDLSPDETAALCYQIMLDYFDTGVCNDDVPTPYWDDEDNADDEEPVDTQTWYGIFDGTFRETVENFVIAGFVAYGAGIGAAITFLTIAPQFRLAWKSGNLGGVIRIFIDARDMGTVDTHAATDGIIEQIFVGDPNLATHEVLMYLES